MIASTSLLNDEKKSNVGQPRLFLGVNRNGGEGETIKEQWWTGNHQRTVVDRKPSATPTVMDEPLSQDAATPLASI